MSREEVKRRIKIITITPFSYSVPNKVHAEYTLDELNEMAKELIMEWQVKYRAEGNTDAVESALKTDNGQPN